MSYGPNAKKQRSDKPQKTTGLDDISEVLVLDIIGHESEAVSRNYTHIDEETKRRAIDAMPNVMEN
jgi:hypothetical protein